MSPKNDTATAQHIRRKSSAGFIKNLVIISVIFVVVFLSQQANLLGEGKTFIFVNGTADRARDFTSVGVKWLSDRALPVISGEAQKRGGMLTAGVAEQVNGKINEQKEKISESISEKIKNYFSGVTESILHPGTPQNCPTETLTD